MSLYQLVRIIDTIVHFYSTLIVVWCLMSWFPMRAGGLAADIRDAISTLVVPYLRIFSKYIPSLGGIDFSPIIAVVVLELLERALIAILFKILV